jgi:hypothetical protein
MYIGPVRTHIATCNTNSQQPSNMASRNQAKAAVSSRPSAKQAMWTKMTRVLFSYLEGETVIASFTNSTSIHELDSLYKLLQ